MGGSEETARPGNRLDSDSPLDLPEPGDLPCRVEGIVSRLIGGETILVPTKSTAQELDDIFTLNEVASTVWDLINGFRSISEISDAVASEYEVTPDQSLVDTQKLIAMFRDADVIDIKPPDS